MSDLGVTVRLGPARAAALDPGTAAEWLLTDGLGGYAMGTASGLRTRRYHGLLVVTTRQGVPLARPGATAERHLALAALDAVLITESSDGSRTRHRLATDEWADGAIDPMGCRLLTGVQVGDGVVRHRWQVGEVLVEREVAMVRGRPAVGVVHRVVRAPGRVRLELTALGTWRTAHGERRAARFGGGPDPVIDVRPEGATVDAVWRIDGPGFVPGDAWYLGVRHREEAARGLADVEDLWHVGTFVADLAPGEHLAVRAWAGPPEILEVPPPAATTIVADARDRVTELIAAAGLPPIPDGTPRDTALRRLVVAADHHVTAAPDVVAGYPWFGAWSRDTMTSYDGLFLATGRVREGAALLRRYAATVSRGMLANTADAGVTEYNAVDATLWFVHAVGRHVAVTGDRALGDELLPVLREILAAHRAGTRFGIVVDPSDGLLLCGRAGDAAVPGDVALTWMDARVAGVAVTPRHGKPVEVQALWINALAVLARLLPGEAHCTEAHCTEADYTGRADVLALHEQAVASFRARFVRPGNAGGGLRDVVDAPGVAGLPVDDHTLRPNQLLAVALPDGPLAGDPKAAEEVVRAVAPLVTPLGPRSLNPGHPDYHGRHRGSPGERDHGYHQGTVWPWLVGPYVDAVRAAGDALAGELLEAVLDGLLGHVGEAGLGSVSETADGDAPHGTTGCPFQAWSVAELLRVLKGSPIPGTRPGRGAPNSA